MELKVNKFTAQLIFFYCVQQFGKHARRPIPKLTWSKINDKETFGDYCYTKNRIRIFFNRHFEPDVKNPVMEMVNTICHEYKHYLDSTKLKQSVCKNNKKLYNKLEVIATKFGDIQSKQFLNKMNS